MNLENRFWKIYYLGMLRKYELLVQYNMLVEKVKQKESFLELKYEVIERATEYSQLNSIRNRILSECNTCIEKIGDNDCDTCGYCICSFCIPMVMETRNDKYKCPQCKTRYEYWNLNEDSDSDDDEENENEYR